MRLILKRTDYAHGAYSLALHIDAATPRLSYLMVQIAGLSGSKLAGSHFSDRCILRGKKSNVSGGHVDAADARVRKG